MNTNVFALVNSYVDIFCQIITADSQQTHVKLARLVYSDTNEIFSDIFGYLPSFPVEKTVQYFLSTNTKYEYNLHTQRERRRWRSKRDRRLMFMDVRICGYSADEVEQELY